jgi:hypothetical protein
MIALTLLETCMWRLFDGGHGWDGGAIGKDAA